MTVEEKLKEEARRDEAFSIQCCVADAKRVHPDWGIDDVINLLEFREQAREALKVHRPNS